MKNKTLLKTLLAQTVVLGLLFIGASAFRNTAVSSIDNKDADFVKWAAEVNLAEVQLGQLAQQNSMSQDVKDLGKMMETAHSKAQSDLSALAKNKGIAFPTVPAAKDQDTYKKLSEKTGHDFDKEYCNMMIAGHKEALATFEKNATEASDADVRAWAKSMLPELRMHLEHSQMCKEKCDKMKNEGKAEKK